ncbi:MAG TPA: hypothetical protein VFB46_10180 [Gemmatimonadaceae bacterium]|nr:hypothetical protein [Gemmatimonadaceae bacterium]
MKRVSPWSSATTTLLVAGALLLGASRLDAAPRPKGDGQTATCAYLLRVMTYPYTSPIIKAWATSLYNSLGCS